MKLIISLSPHVHGGDSVQKNMYGVCAALLPALLASLWFFGAGAAVVMLTSVLACVFFEWAITHFILRKSHTTIFDGKTDGYYSGSTFANIIGLSLQVPMKKEIVSNNIAAIVREVLIGKQSFIVRKTNVPISDDNVKVLQLLELLKNLDSYLDSDYDEAREKLKKYSLANHITRDDVDQYIRRYPDSTFRYYYEMRLDHVLA